MFGSSLSLVVCGRAHVLVVLFVFVSVWWCQAHIVLWFCFVFLRLVYPVLPVSLDCPYLIVPSVFSKVYSLRRDVLAHKTSLTPPLLIEMLVPIQESERWSCICALWVSILPLSMILILDVGIVPIVWYFCFVFHFYLRHLLRNYCEVYSR